MATEGFGYDCSSWNAGYAPELGRRCLAAALLFSLGARCGGDMDGGGGLLHLQDTQPSVRGEPQGLTRRLGSPSGAPCDKAGSMLPPALCLRRRTWGSRGEFLLPSPTEVRGELARFENESHFSPLG